MLRTILSLLTVFALVVGPAVLRAEDQKKDKGQPKAAKAAAGDKAQGEKKKAAGEKKVQGQKKPKAEKGQNRVKMAFGSVKSVDAAAKSITITKPAKDQAAAEDKTFTVADDAKITVHGKAKSLADVVAGAKARLTLSPDRSKVTAIAVGQAKKEGGPKKEKVKKPAA